MVDFYVRLEALFVRDRRNRADFCRQYGHSYSTFTKSWKAGKLPATEVLIDLSKYFHTTTDYLLFGSGNPQKDSARSLDINQVLSIVGHLAAVMDIVESALPGTIPQELFSQADSMSDKVKGSV